MISNTGFFAGKTIVIYGASRGIGLAIAKKLAADNANIVILAKSVTENPRLPGTIFSAAKEVEEAGGRCLPLRCDIRDEHAVCEAVQKTVEVFGGIDILVNNSSAISLADTEQSGANPHVLTISPPLSMDQQWFQHHTAYTISKYGMSMAMLGMSAEFQ
ncbi:NAD(P)-dependent oxidoreductase [Aphelenchoides bicaudatus]|nr:NAD(P)-dependent oxidoreductase [Aphelenchoides bicaudatus]